MDQIKDLRKQAHLDLDRLIYFAKKQGMILIMVFALCLQAHGQIRQFHIEQEEAQARAIYGPIYIWRPGVCAMSI